MSKDDLGQIDVFGGADVEPPPEPEKPTKHRKPKPKEGLSKVERRLMKSSVDIEMNPPEAIAFQHTVLCQTSLPYRDPGLDVREWERRQGQVHLLIEAGKARDPKTDEFVQLGLPFGPAPRLILAHLNAEALKIDSPVIEVEDSLTAFVRRIQKRDPTGPEIRKFKDHLTRLSNAIIRMAVSKDGRDFQVNSQIVDAFELWPSKNENQRVFWPSTIEMNARYFNSLQNHAVPLDERALGVLGHSAFALDVYAWLAQRLHRIPKGKPQFITWAAAADQLGQGYGRMVDFRRKFRKAMAQVKAVYLAANVEDDERGLALRNSPPPIPKRMVLVHKAGG